MVNRKFKEKGTTLIEMMMVVAILGIIFTVVPPLIKNITRFNSLSNARVDTVRGARNSLSQINRNLRQASASSIIISNETGQPPYSSLIFQTVDGRTLKYFQEGTNLQFSNNTSTQTLSENLRFISFTPPRTDDPNILSVSVTFEKAIYEGGSKALQMAIEKVRIMND